MSIGTLKPENTAAQQRAYAECRRIAPLLRADYYPLTEYSLSLNQWIAWQFNRPEQGDGVIQAFRRAACPETSRSLRLRGLDPAVRYELTDFDAQGTREFSGRLLMTDGFRLEIPDKPGAAVIMYRKAG